MLLPPEIGIEHETYDLAPAWVTRSTSYLGVGTGAAFGVGLPHLPTGGIRTGYSWNANTFGELEWYTHNASGVKTLVHSWGPSGPILNVVTTAVNYSVGITDDVVLVTATATITLPSAADAGRLITVKSANSIGPVTVDSVAGNIDGSASQVLTGADSIQCVSDGSDWWVI